jgi:hypothetical protein
MSISSDNSINLDRLVLETSTRDLRLDKKVSELKEKVNSRSSVIKPKYNSEKISFISKTKNSVSDAFENVKVTIESNPIVIYSLPLILTLVVLYFLKPSCVMKEYRRNRVLYKEIDYGLLISTTLFVGLFLDVMLYAYLKK